jgi:hypothetical protein
MIFAFDSVANDGEGKFMIKDEKDRFKDFDSEGYKKHYEREANGLRLFGKYYRCLWD